jgi:hypothetical protein
MSRYLVSVTVCALAMAPMAACDDSADQSGNESSATTCALVSYGGTWWNQAFPEQTGMFHVEFSADVTNPRTDTVIGLSSGPASRWTSLAAAVRFNPQGTIDVRDGSTYRADRVETYTAGTRYWFRVDVDVKARTYSVFMTTAEGGGYFSIARNYKFRTEQLSVTRLNNVAAFVNPETSSQGTAQVCGFTATKDTTTADGCVANVAGGGFISNPITSSNKTLLVSAAARVHTANMDGVIGVASGDVDAYDDFAASVRFFTNGMIEARDGDTYRADNPAPYLAGYDYEIRFVIDLASHTYSVYAVGPNVSNANGGYVQIGAGYKFRPSQARVASLDRVATVIASPTGRLDACGLRGGPHPKMIAVRPGSHDVLPLSDGTALISSGATTTRLDANNAPIGSVAFGGEVAVDAAGSFYVGAIRNGALEVRSFTPALAPRWSVSYPVSGTGSVLDMVVSSAGQVVLLIGVAGDPWNGESPQYMVRLGGDGSYIANDALPSGTAAVGMAVTQYVSARYTDVGVEIATHRYGDPTNFLVQTYWNQPFSVREMALAPDGSFVIGGHLYGEVNFGDGPIAPYSGGGGEVYWDAFVAAFDSNFSTRFSRGLTTYVSGLSTTGPEIAVAYHTRTQLFYVDHAVFDTSGNVVRGTSEDAFVGHFGHPGEITLAPSGRVWLDVFASFGGPADSRYPFTVTLAP